ncbi:putative 1-phosphatidylinositol-3-phosphate 5-kinase FAB1D [Tripterygium wilfordii]|uniref:putative 1-phosphatidylinositol-3-phosphate 5-kinase FAB1D n=1 Tax=Tripterygium wilfordii TaxID=458696 RepID=UPI0018F83344|nr:putative 1-phosphatidylinositol-3-phosphate 5-kinase FAB1D [Tripterygium wilfordii]XP_038697036.1 putative 1-phosphatidylinositol-3-phosphate 5-kinase FAB1D [Tripterygium wilfordii]
MCSTCHYCGIERKNTKDNKRTLEIENSLRLNGEGPIWSCKFCQEKQDGGYMKKDGMSSNVSRTSSTAISLSGSERSISNSSDLSVDANMYNRSNHEGSSTAIYQGDCNFTFDGPLKKSSSEASANEVERLNTVKETTNLKQRIIRNEKDAARDAEVTEVVNGHEEQDNFVQSSSRSLDVECDIYNPVDDELGARIWETPEAEDPEDEMEGSVAYNDDDDDECGDGTKWGKPTSLSHFHDEGSGNYRFIEGKQKAMQEVIDGKFKAHVGQLLKSVGYVHSGKDSESWVDIVTSLSWEAAAFLKHDVLDSKTMDPDGYVKVKCIATGARSQSQLVKGSVFKKNAAHKRMPTTFKNPRLLLIRGVLGQSSSGLSSFKLMDQEKDHLKSLIDMIEICHPNVVLVEKSVSRDVQESILSKGMTLVYDMKLHRLERIARCTGSPIVTSDTLTSQKLRQCDFFHIEKFVEEHAALGEGGKRPSKTLMFIEGCPTHLGCTILLKGSNSEELKRIKYVVQCAVLMAYHLILETSFLADQRAMFSTIFAGEVDIPPQDQEPPFLEGSAAEIGQSTIDIPISNGFHEDGAHNSNINLEANTSLSHVPYNPAILSGLTSLSASLKKVIGDNFPLASSASYKSLSAYLGFNGKDPNGHITEDVPVSTVLEPSDHSEMEVKGNSDEEQSPSESQDVSLVSGNDEVQIKDDIDTVLDSQSILVLMSIRNALRGSICEQSHFSHIMFYRNFDVPLGKFLRDNLLNQKSQCKTCGELPEAHFYYYAHHNKQLTIHVKGISKSLPGEAEGKLWMWSRCGKCKTSKSTKRVVISTASRGLSFGKFLELSFSQSSNRLSSCGHSLEKDFLYFFGLGCMIAMFRYSPVTTYTVSLPPQKLEFRSSIRQEWLKREFENVYTKGLLFFSEVLSSLKKMRSQFTCATLILRGSLKEFSDIEEMLKQESSDFETNIQNAVAKNGHLDQVLYKLLSLNRLRWELLLEVCIWERRLYSLLLPDPSVVDIITTDKSGNKQSQSKVDGATDTGNGSRVDALENGDKVLNDKSDFGFELGTTVEANEYLSREIFVDGPVQAFGEQDDVHNTTVADDSESTRVNGLRINGSPNQEFFLKRDISEHHLSGGISSQAESFTLANDLSMDRTIPISSDLNDIDSFVDATISGKGVSDHSLVSDMENSNGWFWMPFAEIRETYMKDLQRGYVPKFQSISSHTIENLPTAYQLITEEGARLHIPLGINEYIVSDYEGELSSIIACGLAFLKDIPVSTEVLDQYNRKDSGIAGKVTESLHILSRTPTITSPHWSSTSSSDSDLVHSAVGISSEESRFSSFDGLTLLDALVPTETLNPEVSLGFTKSLPKGKYSVICLYANQFHDLRSRCCPSEFDYIASLSRCKNWDAKGGKSGSIFAKTLDDRFIIKEIKKTEFESFVKFAPHYFKYMNQSFDSGNQTCLAKVLGIYQVTSRQTKSGKEARHDLMVMENLSFARNITRQYDLKGALHARFTSAADGSGDVLLDQNFVNDMNSCPLYVSSEAKRHLERAVWNDTTFLNSINVMDYSLLVGVDAQRRELVCGIIDYLRQYTWDKQLETWVKSSLVPKNYSPTVISPKEYKKRFRKFMKTHFLSVPDHWCSQTTAYPCRLCGTRDDSS